MVIRSAGVLTILKPTFGVIAGDDGVEYHLHKSELRDAGSSIGSRVTFVVKTSAKGTHACDVWGEGSAQTEVVDTADSDTRKPRLRTSEEVYQRLKWDHPYSIGSVFVGYTDRFVGPMEMPLGDLQPGGDIPFHRIIYFRTDEFTENDGVIWDRLRRVDFLFNSGETQALNDVSNAEKCKRDELLRSQTRATIQAGQENVRLAAEQAAHDSEVAAQHNHCG